LHVTGVRLHIWWGYVLVKNESKGNDERDSSQLK
jgi:hypothetical protein